MRKKSLMLLIEDAAKFMETAKVMRRRGMTPVMIQAAWRSAMKKSLMSLVEDAVKFMETAKDMRRRGMMPVMFQASEASRAALRRAGVEFETRLGDVYVARHDRKRANLALDLWEERRRR